MHPNLEYLDLLVLDFDGVLTDNRVLVLEDGREAVFCNRADGLGCDMLKNAGLRVIILSTETNQVVTARGQKLGITVIQGSADKESALRDLLAEDKIDATRCGYIGNDVNDLGAMKLVGWPMAPADAHPSILNISKHVFSSVGGGGVLREFSNLLLQ